MPRPTARADLVIRGENRTGKAFGKVRGDLRGLTGTLGGLRTAALSVSAAFGVFQLGRILNESLEAADRIGKLSKQLGTTPEFLQQIGFAAEQSGASLSSVTTAMAFMADAAEEASRGMTTQKKAFEDLNIDVETLLQLSPEEQFMEIADALSEVDSASKRIQLARDLFGRGGVELIPLINEGRDGIRELRDEFVALGGQLSGEQTQAAEDAKDAINELTTAFGALRTELAIGVAPLLANLSTDLLRLIQNINIVLGRYDPATELAVRIRHQRERIEDLEKAYKEAEERGSEFAKERIRDLITFSENLLATLEQKTKESLEPWRKEVRMTREELGGLNEELKDLISQRAKLEEEISDPQIGGTRFWVLESQIEELDKEIRVLTERKQALEKEARDAAAAGAVKPKPTPTGDIESQVPELEPVIVEAAKGFGVLEEAIHRAIVAGGERGSKALVDTFLDTIRSRLVNQLADAVTEAIFGPKAGAKSAEQARKGGLFGILRGVDSILGGFFKKKPTSPEQAADSATQSLLPQSQGGLRCMPGQSPIRTALGGLGGIFKGLGKLLGFEHGGSFMVGGAGGPDSSLVAFRATPGERVTVQTPQQQSTMGNVQVTISNHVTVRGSDAEALRFAKVVSEATEARIIEARRRGRY